jgi:hypothetical protein
MKKLLLKDGTELTLEAYSDNRYTVSCADHKEVMSVWDKMTKENLDGATIFEDEKALFRVVNSEPASMNCSEWSGACLVTFAFQGGQQISAESSLTDNEKQDLEVAKTIVSGAELTKEQAEDTRKIIETVCGENLPDDAAVKMTYLLPEWSGDGIQYQDGRKIRYKGVPYTVLQDHTSQADWAPDKAPSLFAKILIPTDEDGKQIDIPGWEQPDSTNPYKKGDQVTHEGNTYESLIDGNVWEPGAEGSATLWKEAK